VAILVGLMLGMFLAALDQTVVATSIRVIADDLRGFSVQAWATTAFLITSTIATPLYGKLSDIYGRKQFFLFAIVVFIVGSGLCGLAQSMYQLAVFRAVQGIGAGGLFSLALAIVGDIVPPRQRARYQGYFLAVFGTASVVGPVVGGFFAGASSILGIAGWRWIFWINVPVALVALVVVTKVLHLPHTRQDHRIDWPGALALVVGLVPLLLVAEQGRTWGWASAPALLCYAIGGVGLLLFLACERRLGDEALLPLRLFRGRTFVIGTASSAIIGMGMLGGILLLPLYLQIVRGSSPTRAGLELIPLVVGIMSGSLFSGQFVARTGRYRVLPITGTTLLAVSLLLLTLVGADTPLGLTMAIMVVLGFGLGCTMQPTVLAVQNAASPHEIGVSTSAVTFFRSMGGTVGAAVFLSILFAQLPDRVRTAYRQAAETPQFQAAVRNQPEQAQLLTQAAGGQAGLEDTSFLGQLAAPLAHPFKVGFSESMNVAFLAAAGVVLVGLAVIWFLPELPLRRGSAAQERAAQAAAGQPPAT
jgi:EmrB/QacA subfamily drug resistance transporter